MGEPTTAERTGEPTKGIRDFWDWAFKRSPKVARFLFGGYLVLAVAGLIAASTTSLAALFKTALLLLVFSIGVALAIKALSAGKLSFKAEFFLWCVIGLMVAVLMFFVSSAFLGIPERGAVIVARLFELPELLFGANVPSDQSLAVVNGRWPNQVTRPLDVDGDRYSRIDALRRRPSLQLTQDNPIRGGGTIALNRLDLKGDVIVTDGRELTIEAMKVISEGGRIRAFASLGPSESLPRNGGKVTLIVHDRIVGKLMVDLSGRPGDDGRVGDTGGKGGTGAKGDNASSGAFDCSRGAGRGGVGGKGLPGGPGHNGSDGGSGGTLVLAGIEPSSLRRSIDFTSTGGAFGRGGPGGPGGPGGDGGAGGDPRGWCQGGGPTGPGGPQGETGAPGNDGRPGSNGDIVLRTLDPSGTLP